MSKNYDSTGIVIVKLQKALSSRDDVAAAYLFGSYGTEYETEYSDIDLGIIFLPGINADFKRELELEVALSLALGTDRLDVVNLNKAPIQLRYRAISEGRLIYEADYISTSDFIEKTLKYYLDYAYYLKSFFRERNKALKEAYTGGG